MTRNKLYILILVMGFAGQFWIIYSYKRIQKQQETFTLCLFKRVTGLPCPSCGTIHSIICICKGEFKQAFRENPLGYAGILFTGILPFWVLTDLLCGKDSFFRIYLWTQEFLRRKTVLFSFLAVIFLIWMIKLAIFFGFF